MVMGEHELAVRNYRKSLELNPNNTNAAEMLKRLESAAASVDPKIYDAYAGEYEIGPGFVLSVTREGDRLMTQATGQPKFEVFPESETTFSPRAFDAKLTFIKDPQGNVTGVTIRQNGRDIRGKKIK